MNKKFTAALTIIAAIAGTLWIFSAKFQTASAQATASAPAENYTAAAPGLVEPASEERPVGSEVIGILKSVDIEENDTVKAHQIIAVIKNDDQAALLAQANSQLAAARAALIEARKTYERNNVLEKRKLAPTSALDLSQKNYDSAKADVDKYEAVAKQAQANLDKTLIRSPIDGTVLKKLVVAGTAVSNQPPTQIAIIGDLSSLRVRADVDELDIGRIHEGQRVKIKADAYPNLNVGGTIIRINKRLGARRVQTDRSSEKSDNKVLQTLIALDAGAALPVGLRVDVYFLAEPKVLTEPKAH